MAWALLRGARPRHQYLHSAQLLRVYARVRAWVLDQGCTAERHPFPAGLWAALITPGGHADNLAAAAAALPAAEDGRRVR